MVWPPVSGCTSNNAAVFVVCFLVACRLAGAIISGTVLWLSVLCRQCSSNWWVGAVGVCVRTMCCAWNPLGVLMQPIPCIRVCGVLCVLLLSMLWTWAVEQLARSMCGRRSSKGKLQQRSV